MKRVKAAVQTVQKTKRGRCSVRAKIIRAALIVLLAAAALLAAGVILSFSRRTGTASNRQSEAVRQTIVSVMRRLGITHPDLSFLRRLYPYDANMNLGSIAVRKLAHMTEYACFGIICAALLSFIPLREIGIALCVLIGPSLALFDEKYVQVRLSVGRTSSYRDVLLDSAGFYTGVLLTVFVLFLIHRLRHGRKARRAG